jgi:periplasmic protein TonB
MTGYWKPLQLSLILHGIILLAVLKINMPMMITQNILVIDFTMEDGLYSLPRRSETATVPPAAGPADIRRDTEVFQPVQKLQDEIQKEKHEDEKNEPAPSPPAAADVKQAEAEIQAMRPWLTGFAQETDLTEFTGYGAKSNTGDSGVGQGHPDGPTDGSGGGSAVSSEKSVYIKAHFAYIRDIVHRHLVYPAKARKMGWEGKVITSFIVSSGGYARDIRISRSSGYDILDRNAIQAIRDASPFPHPPAEAQIIIPILYRLN